MHPFKRLGPGYRVSTAFAAVALAGAIALPGMAAETSIRSCSTHDFKITELPSQGAGGSFLLALSYRNITHSSCRTRGFPGVTLLGSQHHRLGVGQRIGKKIPHLDVKPRARVYGTIEYSETPRPPRHCRAVKAARIIAPDSTQSSTVQLPHGSEYCFPPIFVHPLARSSRGSLNS